MLNILLHLLLIASSLATTMLVAPPAYATLGGDVRGSVRGSPEADNGEENGWLTARYSVVVDRVPVDQLLFALARDSRADIDIRPGVRGVVSLSAVDQTLPVILERISRQVPLRYEFGERSVLVGPDDAYARSYLLDYVNMTRKLKANVSISASIAAVGGTVGARSQSGAGNASSAELVDVAENQLWTVLERNLEDLLREDDTPEAPAADEAFAAAGRPLSPAAPARRRGRVIVNAEAGVLTVVASQRQHRLVEAFLRDVQTSARRQVLIEATLVEVLLDERHQAGVDWASVGRRLQTSFDLSQRLVGNAFGAGPAATLTFQRSLGSNGTVDATVKLLESFGTTRVLSSPKVMALNNQTALLKVVDEKVYFEIGVQRTEATQNAQARTDYTSTVRSVPIGVMMSVTPQISRAGEVLLNVRPTITRVTGYKADPVPTLIGAGVDNLIPEIQVREIESTLKLASGQAAVLGGLMQENAELDKRGVPVLMDLPLIGHLFSYRDDVRRKTELVIFLRPTVIEHETEAAVAAAPATPRFAGIGEEDSR